MRSYTHCTSTDMLPLTQSLSLILTGSPCSLNTNSVLSCHAHCMPHSAPMDVMGRSGKAAAESTSGTLLHPPGAILGPSSRALLLASSCPGRATCGQAQTAPERIMPIAPHGPAARRCLIA